MLQPISKNKGLPIHQNQSFECEAMIHNQWGRYNSYFYIYTNILKPSVSFPFYT
jgi:hypothetical protein